MGRLVSKAHRVSPDGAMLVNYASNREGGVQVGQFDGGNGNRCVPLAPSDGSPLEDRKHLVMTVPIDRVWFGPSGVTMTTGYEVRGARRHLTLDFAPGLDAYSNRMQFLRGQYTSLPLLSGVTFCVHIRSALVSVNSLETS